MTLSGAGAPLAKLYLMPKSSVGPSSVSRARGALYDMLTSGVMAGSQKDASSSLSYPDDMAGGWCAENAVLADQELLDTVCGADFGNDLSDLGIPVAAVTADDEERAGNAFRDGLEDAGYKGLGVVVLLEHLDLLAQARTGAEPHVSHGHQWATYRGLGELALLLQMLYTNCSSVVCSALPRPSGAAAASWGRAGVGESLIPLTCRASGPGRA